MHSHHWTIQSMVEESCKFVTQIIFREYGEGLVCGVYFRNPISLFAHVGH
jgi:hypothetical protein